MATCNQFGLPVNDLGSEKIFDDSIEVFTFGRPPVCIELIVKVSGFEFNDIYKNAKILSPDGFPVKVVSYTDLVIMKNKAGRPKDIDDLNNISE